MNDDFFFSDLNRPQKCLVIDKTRFSLPENIFTTPELNHVQTHYQNIERRDEWLWGRFVLKVLLQRQFGLAMKDITVLSDGPRPVVVEPKSISGQNLFVSVAHKNNYFMAGASLESPVGVDLEVANDSSGLSAIRRVCSSEELAAAKTHPQLSEKDFLYLAWCIKECCVKAQITNTVFDLKNAPTDFSPCEIDTKFSFFNAKIFSVDVTSARAFFRDDFYAAIVAA